MIESCYWVIKAKENTFKDESMIYIYLDSSTTANMFVYAGTDRRNVTLIIEGNSSAPIGAPIRVPISSGAIVLLQVANG